MMPPIVFEVTLFRERGDTREHKRSHQALLHLLECLCLINEGLLGQEPSLPRLYESGVKYIREAKGQERWLDVLHIIKEGGGDCEDLACWRVAELRHQGVRAKPFAKWAKDAAGTFHYHAQVVRYREDGTHYIEDPSHRLGMRGGSDFAEVDERVV